MNADNGSTNSFLSIYFIAAIIFIILFVILLIFWFFAGPDYSVLIIGISILFLIIGVLLLGYFFFFIRVDNSSNSPPPLGTGTLKYGDTVRLSNILSTSIEGGFLSPCGIWTDITNSDNQCQIAGSLRNTQSCIDNDCKNNFLRDWRIDSGTSGVTSGAGAAGNPVKYGDTIKIVSLAKESVPDPVTGVPLALCQYNNTQFNPTSRVTIVNPNFTEGTQFWTITRDPSNTTTSDIVTYNAPVNFVNNSVLATGVQNPVLYSCPCSDTQCCDFTGNNCGNMVLVNVVNNPITEQGKWFVHQAS